MFDLQYLNEINYVLIVCLICIIIYQNYKFKILKNDYDLNIKYEFMTQELNLKYEHLNTSLTEKITRLMLLHESVELLKFKYNEHSSLLTTIINDVDGHTKSIALIHKKYEPEMYEFTKSFTKLFEKMDEEEHRINSKFNSENLKLLEHLANIKRSFDETNTKLTSVTNAFDQFRNEIRKEIRNR